MLFPERTSDAGITVKAESAFYAALQGCPPSLLSATRGLTLERGDLGTYLVMTKDVLVPRTIFSRYLSLERSRRVFGADHPLYGKVGVEYGSGGEPIGVNRFSTRFLLAFFEVHLGLGFSGSSFWRHRRAIEAILAGKRVEMETNYYHPFTHRDNVGIHYVRGSEQEGSGYDRDDWRRFIAYSTGAMRYAYDLSPEDFGGTEEGLRRAIGQFPERVADAHARDGSIPIFPIRHWSDIVEHIPCDQHPRDGHLIVCSETGGSVPYIPFVDCVLDMPYKDGAVVIFQSVCGGR